MKCFAFHMIWLGMFGGCFHVVLAVFLCDDDEEAIAVYGGRVAEVAGRYGLQVNISGFPGGKDLLFRLSDSPNEADIIFLDIMMDSLNGLEIAKRLRALGCKAEIIFLTTSEDYVFDAYDVTPVQYLIKGVASDEKFERAFMRAVSLVQAKKPEMFTCKSGDSVKVIPFSDIVYFEVFVRIVIAHCSDGNNFEFYATLKQLEAQLVGKNFARTHRSYLVNMHYISKLTPKGLRLQSGEEIPVGKTYARSFKEEFSNYVSKLNIYHF